MDKPEIDRFLAGTEMAVIATINQDPNDNWLALLERGPAP
jgi:hypothetical protein